MKKLASGFWVETNNHCLVMAIDGNDLMTNLGEALQFRGRVIFVFLLPVNIVVKVVKMRILILVIFYTL